MGRIFSGLNAILNEGEMTMGEKPKQENPANAIKDMMWSFLMDHGQQANIPALKEAVHDLIQAITQKDAGQRKDKRKNFDWDNLDMLFMEIAIEATALVLSGELDKLEEGVKNEAISAPRIGT